MGERGVGAGYGEIPLFEPGAGSATSAGMTVKGSAGLTVRGRGYDGEGVTGATARFSVGASVGGGGRW